jgi:hypothetical protein
MRGIAGSPVGVAKEDRPVKKSFRKADTTIGKAIVGIGVVGGSLVLMLFCRKWGVASKSRPLLGFVGVLWALFDGGP